MQTKAMGWRNFQLTLQRDTDRQLRARERRWLRRRLAAIAAGAIIVGALTWEAARDIIAAWRGL